MRTVGVRRRLAPTPRATTITKQKPQTRRLTAGPRDDMWNGRAKKNANHRSGGPRYSPDNQKGAADPPFFVVGPHYAWGMRR